MLLIHVDADGDVHSPENFTFNSPAAQRIWMDEIMRKDLGKCWLSLLLHLVSSSSGHHSTPFINSVSLTKHCKQSGAIKKENLLKNSSRPFLLDISWSIISAHDARAIIPAVYRFFYPFTLSSIRETLRRNKQHEKEAVQLTTICCVWFCIGDISA